MESSLEETCEILFQMHKQEQDFKIWWTFDTFNGKPKNLTPAKDLLLHKGILTEKTINKQYSTSLNPELFFVDNYKEALTVLEKKEKKTAISIEQIGDRYHAESNGANSLAMSGETVNAEINKPAASKKEKWWEKAIDKVIDSAVPIIVTAILTSAITYISTRQAASPNNIQLEQKSKGLIKAPDSLQKNPT